MARASTAQRKRRSVARSVEVFTWHPTAFLGSSVPRDDGRDLFLYVAGSGARWIVLALEGPRSKDPIAVFGDHAHRLIGEFANPAAAQRAGEGFAKRWLRGAKIDMCGCGDIKSAA